MNKELAFKTFRNTALAAIYIFLVSQVMQNGDKLFGNGSSIFGPFVILLLFCLSAATVSSLVLGLSVYLFLDGKKKESVTAATYSIGWLGLFTVLGLLTLIIIK